MCFSRWNSGDLRLFLYVHIYTVHHINDGRDGLMDVARANHPVGIIAINSIIHHVHLAIITVINELFIMRLEVIIFARP